jgi:hypothetical protein
MMALAASSSSLATLLTFLILGGFGFSVLNPATGKAVVEWFSAAGAWDGDGNQADRPQRSAVLWRALALPPIALAWSWRVALALAGALSLASAVLVSILYNPHPVAASGPASDRPRIAELGTFLRRPADPHRVRLRAGAIDRPVVAPRVPRALHQGDVRGLRGDGGAVPGPRSGGGTLSRVAWGVTSDRSFGGRRRPGVVASAAIGGVAYALLALGALLPLPLMVPLALVAGAGAFGWVGLYFALVAEIGGPRYAGLLTGAATACSWERHAHRSADLRRAARGHRRLYPAVARADGGRRSGRDHASAPRAARAAWLKTAGCGRLLSA